MAEETTITNDGVGTQPVNPTPPTEPANPVVETQPVNPAGEGEENQPAGNPVVDPKPTEGGEEKPASEPAAPAGDSFDISDIEWPEGIPLDDEAKASLIEEMRGAFKGKAEANNYIKNLAEANKKNKENQAKRIKDLELGWENALKTDSDFGKDYDGNKKLVVNTAKKFSSDADFAEMEKFGFTKSPAFNRMMHKIAKEFEGAKVVKGSQPNPTPASKTDSYGRKLLDFTKPQ